MSLILWMFCTFIASSLIQDAAGNKGYVVLVPAALRSGTDQAVAVTIMEPSEPVHVDLKLYAPTGKQVVHSSQKIFGKGTLHLKIPEEACGLHKLKICGNCVSPRPGMYTFYNSTQVPVKRKSTSVFIMTDRPIYKPGQKVLIRLVTLKSDMRPADPHMIAYITDPRGSRMIHWDNLKPFCTGLVNLTFPLSDQPVLGTWTIIVLSQGQRYNKTFAIEKSALPKFEVHVDPPKYIGDWKRCYAVFVKASYIHGRPVTGILKTRMLIHGLGYYKSFTSLTLENKKRIQGSVMVRACVPRMLAGSPRRLEPHFHGVLHVEAVVTADDSQWVKVIDDSCTVHHHLVDLEFSEDTRDHFRPGLPFKGKLHVYYPDGSPADNMTVQVQADEASQQYTSSAGQVIFTLPPVPLETQSLWIEAKVTSLSGQPTDMRYQPVYKYVNSWHTSSKCQLLITDIMHSFKVGDKATFQVQSTCPCNFTLYHEAMAKGVLVDTGFHYNPHVQDFSRNNEIPHAELPPRKGNTNEVCSMTFDLEVTKDMVPLTRLVVYYLLPNREGVTDSISFSVEPRFDNQLHVDLAGKKVLPGSPFDLGLTSQPGSCVCAAAIDKSAYLVDPGYQLDYQEVLDELSTYDLSIHKKDVVDAVLHHRTRVQRQSLGDMLQARHSEYAFQEVGLVVLTDIMNLQNRDDVPPIIGPIFEAPLPGHLLQAEFSPTQQFLHTDYKSRKKKRNYFPDLWLWDCWKFGEGESYLMKNLQVPDTVTRWMVSGMSLSPHHGLALTSFQEVTATKRFFIDFNLPYSVIRGEWVIFPVTLHNYLDSCVTVRLRFRVPRGSRLASSMRRQEIQENCVDAGSAKLFEFMLYFKKLGLQKIKASAQAYVGGDCCGMWNNDVVRRAGRRVAKDTITRDMLVEAEGQPKSYTHSVFFCPNERIHLSTPRRYEYQYVKTPPWMQKFSFTVKAGQDVHLALSNSPRDNDDMFEIVLGGNGNSKSWIAKGKKGNRLVSVGSDGIVNRDEFRAFWVKWTGQQIEVGVGERLGQKTSILHYNVRRYFKVHYIGFATSGSSDGEFRIWEKQEIDSHFGQVLHLSLPKKHIKGSQSANIKVVGNIMGPSLHSLDNLMELPNGCGEQNMANFAPGIFVLNYLSHTSQLSMKTIHRITEYLLKGYQRQLTYKRDDGSYSAFGVKDKTGSMWLTAFVVKCYLLAQDHMYIDPSEINRAVNWILAHQRRDGSFPVVGKILNKEIQGGVRSRVSLTAYIAIAIVEKGSELKVSKKTVGAIKHFLETRLQRVSDPYNLALCAYSLSLLDSDFTHLALRKLNHKAVKADGSTYWKLSGHRSQEVILDVGSAQKKQVRAAEVEIAAYAVLAFLSRRDLSSALPVIKWLSQQRNAHGSFFSTQDTCVGLQALAQFAKMAHGGPINLAITVATTNLDLQHKFSVNKTNAKVTQEATIPSLPNGLFISALGQGCALLQVEVNYNVPTPTEHQSFSLDMQVHKHKKHYRRQHKHRHSHKGSRQKVRVSEGQKPKLLFGEKRVGLPGMGAPIRIDTSPDLAKAPWSPVGHHTLVGASPVDKGYRYSQSGSKSQNRQALKSDLKYVTNSIQPVGSLFQNKNPWQNAVDEKHSRGKPSVGMGTGPVLAENKPDLGTGKENQTGAKPQGQPIVLNLQTFVKHSTENRKSNPKSDPNFEEVMTYSKSQKQAGLKDINDTEKSPGSVKAEKPESTTENDTSYPRDPIGPASEADTDEDAQDEDDEIPLNFWEVDTGDYSDYEVYYDHDLENNSDTTKMETSIKTLKTKTDIDTTKIKTDVNSDNTKVETKTDSDTPTIETEADSDAPKVRTDEIPHLVEGHAEFSTEEPNYRNKLKATQNQLKLMHEDYWHHDAHESSYPSKEESHADGTENTFELDEEEDIVTFGYIEDKDGSTEPVYTGAEPSKSPENPEHTDEYDDEKVLTVDACTRWLNHGSSNMAVLEVSLPSGYKANEASIQKLMSHGHLHMKQYEISGRKVRFYFDEIHSDCLTCLSFEIYREFQVELTKPVPLRVYDYYEPGYESTEFYQSRTPKEKDQTNCNSTDGSCQSAEKPNSHASVPRCSCYLDCHEAGPKVCGSDGVIYPNQCRMEVDSCRHGNRLFAMPMEYCLQEVGSGESSGELHDASTPHPVDDGKITSMAYQQTTDSPEQAYTNDQTSTPGPTNYSGVEPQSNVTVVTTEQMITDIYENHKNSTPLLNQTVDIEIGAVNISNANSSAASLINYIYNSTSMIMYNNGSNNSMMSSDPAEVKGQGYFNNSYLTDRNMSLQSGGNQTEIIMNKTDGQKVHQNLTFNDTDKENNPNIFLTNIKRMDRNDTENLMNETSDDSINTTSIYNDNNLIEYHKIDNTSFESLNVSTASPETAESGRKNVYDIGKAGDQLITGNYDNLGYENLNVSDENVTYNNINTATVTASAGDQYTMNEGVINSSVELFQTEITTEQNQASVTGPDTLSDHVSHKLANSSSDSVTVETALAAAANKSLQTTEEVPTSVQVTESDKTNKESNVTAHLSHQHNVTTGSTGQEPFTTEPIQYGLVNNSAPSVYNAETFEDTIRKETLNDSNEGLLRNVTNEKFVPDCGKDCATDSPESIVEKKSEFDVINSSIGRNIESAEMQNVHNVDVESQEAESSTLYPSVRVDDSVTVDSSSLKYRNENKVTLTTPVIQGHTQPVEKHASEPITTPNPAENEGQTVTEVTSTDLQAENRAQSVTELAPTNLQTVSGDQHISEVTTANIYTGRTDQTFTLVTDSDEIITIPSMTSTELVNSSPVIDREIPTNYVIQSDNLVTDTNVHSVIESSEDSKIKPQDMGGTGHVEASPHVLGSVEPESKSQGSYHGEGQRSASSDSMVTNHLYSEQTERLKTETDPTTRATEQDTT